MTPPPVDRFYIPPDHWAGFHLEGDEAHHCSRVMRKSVGDVVEVFDGAGRRAQAGIAGIEGGSVLLEKHREVCAEPPAPRVTLGIAIPKGKTMELVVQKAVELGVACIQPLVTEHTVVRVDDVARKQAKWQRVALEACKQCGQDFLPRVEGPQPLGAWLPMRIRDATGIVASLAEGAREFRGVLEGLDPAPAKIEILVGPEGDFTAGEISAVVAEGFVPVSLGKGVLRVETAVLYCLSVLRYEFGSM